MLYLAPRILDHDVVFPTRAELHNVRNTTSLANGDSIHIPPNIDESSPAQRTFEQASISPLNKALTVDRGSLESSVKLSVLAVGVANKKFRGPKIDLKWLGLLLPKAIFRAITGTDAVRGKIFQAIRQIFQNADPATLVVLYFTGHSRDSSNAFKLYGRQWIDEDTLLRWIKRIREETNNHLPVLIVLDCCRLYNAAPPALLSQLENVHIVWTCALGQRSYDTDLGAKVPYSNFLKAVCLALNEALANTDHPSSCFLGGVDTWLSRIVKMLRGIACRRARCPKRWNDCACKAYCFKGLLCPHPNHCGGDITTLQRPTWLFSGSQDDMTTDRLLRCIQPILSDDMINKVQLATDAIQTYRWYEEFVLSDSAPIPNQCKNAFGTTEPKALHKPDIPPVTASVPLMSYTKSVKRGKSGGLMAAEI
ncbi:hypothetical protein FRC12_018770 [Ceratobasidium sp. 428]|nr:hypothetical protein FRC12_018770 [Ceratobasidium sp. 428]